MVQCICSIREEVDRDERRMLQQGLCSQESWMMYSLLNLGNLLRAAGVVLEA